MKSIFLLLNIFLLCNISAQDKIPEYEGDEIDLIQYKISTLYKGFNKEFVANRLDVEGIYNHVSKEKNLWHIIVAFNIEKTLIYEEDIWIQLRTNINAATVHLNDNLFFKNGVVLHTTQAEIGGKNLIRKKIPKDFLIDGHNKIEITFSNYKDQKGAVFRDLAIGNLEGFQKNTAIMSTAPILFFGIFLFAFFINIVLYFSLNRKKVFIMLAALFLINSLLVLYEVLYWNGLVPAVSFIHSYTLRSGLEYLTYFILLFILFYEYNFSKKYLLLAVLAFIAIYIFASFIQISIAVALSFLPFAFSVLALYQKKENSILITISLFILFIFNYIDDNDLIESFDIIYSNYMITSIVYKMDNLAMVFFALLMIFTSAKGILSKTHALNDAKLKLERLEYQFLQKHIQPHFLMNSLMSLQQLVVNDKENANKMIEALSEEFHLLTTMSKKKTVPILEEIEMCKTHLKIMSIQQKANYHMEVKGIKGNEMIPPAVIHTLVENGITHGYSGNEDAYFELHKEETVTNIQYRLFNDSKGKSSGKIQSNSGTGLKYIEARLEECYPGNWELQSKPTTNGWEAVITIKKQG
ncbi:hypothetical protein GTQ40_07100 [Flavobacteriaceae bacterium R38]|nr:hypothetical protein [Flavobacteriaceae bacterium R38]